MSNESKTLQLAREYVASGIAASNPQHRSLFRSRLCFIMTLGHKPKAPDEVEVLRKAVSPLFREPKAVGTFPVTDNDHLTRKEAYAYRNRRGYLTYQIRHHPRHDLIHKWRDELKLIRYALNTKKVERPVRVQETKVSAEHPQKDQGEVSEHAQVVCVEERGQVLPSRRSRFV